jgi:hypothetical protein
MDAAIRGSLLFAQQEVLGYLQPSKHHRHPTTKMLLPTREIMV